MKTVDYKGNCFTTLIKIRLEHQLALVSVALLKLKELQGFIVVEDFACICGSLHFVVLCARCNCGNKILKVENLSDVGPNSALDYTM